MAATFKEFYVQQTGSNLNAGSSNADAASLTYASGSWVASTGVFTVASGNPSSDGVAVGDFVSVYADGSTVTGFVGRVTARDTTTITVSLTVKGGTAPADGSSNRTLKVGGAWAGPSGASQFPFNTVASGAMVDTNGHSPRVNFKSGTSYSITAQITLNLDTGPIVYEGYTTTIGDGGRAVIDGGTSGASYNLVRAPSAGGSAKNHRFRYFEFMNNGATGSASGINFDSGNENCFQFCVMHEIRGTGFDSSSVNHFYECESYNCNQSNTSAKGGFVGFATGVSFYNCISHHNSGSNSCGFQTDGGISMINCIAAYNGSSGGRSTADVSHTIIGNTFYGNGGSGFDFGGSNGTLSDPMLMNFCNNYFGKNSAAGIRFSASSAKYAVGQMKNNAFGMGTEANATGNYVSTSGGASNDGSSLEGIDVTDTVLLTADVIPFVSPSTGDFRVNHPSLMGAGFGDYLQTYTGSTWTGTVGYPHVGSASARTNTGRSNVS